MNLNTVMRQVNLQTFALLIFLAFCAFALYAPSAQALPAPANSVIGNQASATYLDNLLAPRSASSNTVQTTVAQVKSFTLTQTGAKSASANQQVCYPHTITNTGNGADTYALNLPTTLTPPVTMAAHTGLVYYLDANQDGSPDNGTAITTSGSLGSGLAFNFVVCGTTPVGAMIAQAGTITVSATDTNTPTATTLSRTNTTTITAASISVQKRLSSVAPPGNTPVPNGPSPNGLALPVSLTNPNPTLFVVLDYTNTGTIAGTDLLITDALPSGWVYVAGSGRWSGSGVTALTDAAMGDPAGVEYSAITGTVTSRILTVPGSTSGNIYFQISIAPNLAVTTGTPASQLITTNVAQYAYTSGPTPVPSTNTNSVLYSVLQSAAVSANGSSTTTGLTDSEPVTVASASPGQTITFTDVIWNMGNAPDSFDITLNTPLNGSACAPGNTAPAQCTFPANTTFQILATGGMSSLLDSNGNSIPDTGQIPVPILGVCAAPYIISTSMPLRCGYPIVISATLPAAAASGTPVNGFQVTVTATSFFNALGVSDTVPNRLNTIAASVVDVTNVAAFGNVLATGVGAGTSTFVTANSVTPAIAGTTTTRFVLYVNNRGAVAQIYNLTSRFTLLPAVWVALTPPAAPLVPPTGWTVSFFLDSGGGSCAATTGPAITSTGAAPVPALGSQLICAEVTIPATNTGNGGSIPSYAAPGNYDIEFKATQQSDSTISDIKVDRVTVNSLRNVTITPNGAQSTIPGGSVTYTHSLKNNGNVTEAITFPTAAFLVDSQFPTYTWSSTAFIDTNNNGILDIGTDTAIAFGATTIPALAPNVSQTIFIRVNAPAMAGSPVNTTQITATYSTGPTLTASATDQTTLTDGLKLDKYQQLPAGTGSCLGGTPAATLTGTVPNAPWSSMAIPASANTVPGRCIAYLIVGSNTTATNITNVNLADVVPANTKLETGCGVPTVTGLIALSVPGTYITGYTGSIVATSTAALPPTSVFTMQFCVKINDM